MEKQQVTARVDALLARMTLEEKVAQMMQIPYSMVDREEALHWARLGAGSFLHVLGDDARELQRTALQTRMGIPVIFGIDAIHGHGLNDHATIFPTQLAAACSFDREQVEKMGRVTAREVATDGLHWTFSPVLCLGRDTRWGRVNETFGEDPYLAGELGAAIIKGYQGKDLSDPESILACAKHYIGYGEAVGARDACDTEMTFRKMRETFLPPFEKAVEAGCATIMTAYGSIDGTPFTISKKTLRDILRDELHFDGFVVTDWDNMHSLMTNQHVADTELDAAKLTAQAGNDMIMTSRAFYEAAIKLVREGLMPEAVIDDAARHILTMKVRMGLFEQPEKLGKPGCFACKEHLEASRTMARESVTLLKNNGMLPLERTVKRIAVIGPNADDIRAQYGDWTYFTHPLPHPEREAIRPFVTVKEGMEALAKEAGAQVVYAKGCGIFESESDDLDAAVQACEGADAIVLVVGDRIEQVGEHKDRANLTLSGRQLELFDRLRALNIPLTTVLLSSKPLCMAQAAEKADALLVAFNGGMFGGQAVAEAIFGKINPSGRLPISFPHHSGQIPVYYNHLPGWHGGKYMDLPAEPAFTFGEGLSYTSFRFENLRFDKNALTAQVDVSNTGDRDGATVVQVYTRDVVSSVMTPVRRLIAFERVALQAGETKTVVFALSRKDFSLVLPDERRVVEPGAFDLWVGGSAKEQDLLKTTFELR